jgi:mono/diheme cytochrome c family protein
MHARTMMIPATLLVLLTTLGTAVAGQPSNKAMLEHGRYLLRVGGCNDCHTPGYAEAGGQLPEQQWLIGSPVGFHGPWGVTYASNLRLGMQSMSEAEWLQHARTAMRPPMPFPSLMAMSDYDLKCIYRFVRSLGPLGETTPAYVPPGQAVVTPYIDFMPKNLPSGPLASKPDKPI